MKLIDTKPVKVVKAVEKVADKATKPRVVRYSATAVVIWLGLKALKTLVFGSPE